MRRWGCAWLTVVIRPLSLSNCGLGAQELESRPVPWPWPKGLHSLDWALQAEQGIGAAVGGLGVTPSEEEEP